MATLCTRKQASARRKCGTRALREQHRRRWSGRGETSPLYLRIADWCVPGRCYYHFMCFTGAEINAIVASLEEGRAENLDAAGVRTCLAKFFGPGRQAVIVLPSKNGRYTECYLGPADDEIGMVANLGYSFARPQDRRAFAVPLFDYDMDIERAESGTQPSSKYRDKEHPLHRLTLATARQFRQNAEGKRFEPRNITDDWLRRLKGFFTELDAILNDRGTGHRILTSLIDARAVHRKLTSLSSSCRHAARFPYLSVPGKWGTFYQDPIQQSTPSQLPNIIKPSRRARTRHLYSEEY